jgi:small subunit ribosomal protein S29
VEPDPLPLFEPTEENIGKAMRFMEEQDVDAFVEGLETAREEEDEEDQEMVMDSVDNANASLSGLPSASGASLAAETALEPAEHEEIEDQVEQADDELPPGPSGQPPTRWFGVPRPTLLEYRLLSQQATVIRDVTVEVVKIMEEGKEFTSDQTRIVFGAYMRCFLCRIQCADAYRTAGPPGSGKSMLLLQAVHHAHQNGWIVLYFPRTSSLLLSQTPHVYSLHTQTYTQPTVIYQTLKRFAKVNERALKNIYVREEFALPANPAGAAASAAAGASYAGSSSADVEEGGEEGDSAPEVGGIDEIDPTTGLKRSKAQLKLLAIQKEKAVKRAARENAELKAREAREKRVAGLKSRLEADREKEVANDEKRMGTEESGVAAVSLPSLESASSLPSAHSAGGDSTGPLHEDHKSHLSESWVNKEIEEFDEDEEMEFEQEEDDEDEWTEIDRAAYAMRGLGSVGPLLEGEFRIATKDFTVNLSYHSKLC